MYWQARQASQGELWQCTVNKTFYEKLAGWLLNVKNFKAEFFWAIKAKKTERE